VCFLAEKGILFLNPPQRQVWFSFAPPIGVFRSVFEDDARFL
jgi:hypothetical protein